MNTVPGFSEFDLGRTAKMRHFAFRWSADGATLGTGGRMQVVRFIPITKKVLLTRFTFQSAFYLPNAVNDAFCALIIRGRATSPSTIINVGDAHPDMLAYHVASSNGAAATAAPFMPITTTHDFPAPQFMPVILSGDVLAVCTTNNPTGGNISGTVAFSIYEIGS
jgi:hypothetical protein